MTEGQAGESGCHSDNVSIQKAGGGFPSRRKRCCCHRSIDRPVASGETLHESQQYHADVGEETPVAHYFPCLDPSCVNYSFRRSGHTVDATHFHEFILKPCLRLLLISCLFHPRCFLTVSSFHLHHLLCAFDVKMFGRKIKQPSSQPKGCFLSLTLTRDVIQLTA